MLIRDLLKLKSSQPTLVSPDSDIREAAAMMVDQAVSALIVMTQDGELAGILTERDVARFFVEDTGADTDKAAATVSAAMTSDVISCSTDHPVSEIAATMSDSNIRHLPVLKQGKVVALVTIRDIVRFHLSALETENRTLRELVAALD